ncbi:sulfotransferase family protein [Ruegeria arenilitoris]|uniref:sulfotransferase family protein n=1 Tax=Ruegeria arenilitoris TaxID=1173585 RepID=UPI001479AD7E|nr:sulfotransferase [Ruegeria arenilitoris]
MTEPTSVRPIFIGACPRSGTTFLGDRVGALLNGRVMPESQFKRPALRALAVNGPEVAVKVLDSERSYRLWRDRPARETLLKCNDAASFLSHLVFPEGVPVGTAPIWVDHTPINFEDFSILRRAFPNARFVNLVRDGRAVFSSVRGLEWGPRNPMHASWWWAARTAPGLAASLRHPDCCITVRYEDLARGHLDDWSSLLSFLTAGEKRSVTPEELSASSGFEVPDYTRHQHQLVGEAPSADRVESWRTTLSQREIEIFEANNGGALLEMLGYDRLFSFPRPAIRSEMIRMGEWPFRVTAEPIKKFKQALRWNKVKSADKVTSA